MEPDHLLTELRRRIDVALAKLDQAADTATRLGKTIDKTGPLSDASQALEARLIKLGDEYHELCADVERLRQVLAARTKCRGHLPAGAEMVGHLREIR